jgi:CheY-like chemotaxis protein
VILIVDDHFDTGSILARLLKAHGHLALAVISGPAALQRLSTDNVSLIVLDKCMPDMDGIDVLRLVRANARWRTIPVIMYSADTNLADISLAKQAGAQEYFVKGVTPWNEVCARITRYNPIRATHH